MRLLFLLALAVGVLPGVCESSVAADAAPAVRPAEPPRATHPLLDLLWPGCLLVGYISMDLKRQLRRRGHHGDDRRQAFADLISLRRSLDAQDQASHPKDDRPTPSDR